MLGRLRHDNVYSILNESLRFSKELQILNTIFCISIRIKEHIPVALLPLAREKYG